MPIFSVEDLLTSPGDFAPVYADAARFWAADGRDQSQINVFLLDRATIERFPLRLARGMGWRFSDNIYLRVTINGPQAATPVWALTEEDQMGGYSFGTRIFKTDYRYLLGRSSIFRNSTDPTTLIYRLPLQIYGRMVRAYEQDAVNTARTGRFFPHDGLCGIFQQCTDSGGNTVYRVAFTLFRYNPGVSHNQARVNRNDVIIYQFDGGGGGGGAGANIPAIL